MNKSIILLKGDFYINTILALDQSTKVTGYSVFIEDRLVNYGTLEVDENEKNPIERMKIMIEKIKRLTDVTSPDYIVFENVQYQNNFGTFQQLSQLQGVVMAFLFETNIGFTIIEPSAWKSCCGIRGRKRVEQKKNTQIFVKDTYNIDTCEDEADAIGIGTWAIQNIKMQKGNK